MTFKQLVLPALIAVCASCGQNAEPHPRTTDENKLQKSAPAAEPPPEMPKEVFRYHFEKKAIWKQKDSFEGYNHKRVIAALNRVDLAHLQRLDSFIVPDRYVDSVAAYMPFPAQSAVLKDIRKIILFSYPAQAFAAYENGQLVLTGPTNMGKKASPTPTGLFFCNWKARETRSTVDNEWILKWNFNVSNMGGVGFHQYDLPGYPASHSCMRLWAEQAEFLYGWAEQWKLSGSDQLLAKGTPVVIFGTYPFGKPRPWFALVNDNKALEINESQLEEIITPHKEKILEEQRSRMEQFPPAPDTAVAVAIR